MEKNKRSVIVGLFITVGLAIMVTGIFTLGGQRDIFTRSLAVSAIFENVNGLQKGDNVWFSGVKIGTVEDIAFHGNSQVKVTMHIQEKARQYIRRDAKASISAEGLIGNKLIVISEGSPGVPAVAGGETLQTVEATTPADMMATLQENNENLVSITSDLMKVSERLAAGEGTLGALLTDASLFNKLQASAARLQTAARNSEQFTGNLSNYTARLQAPGTLAAELVSDTMIMANLRTAASQINEAAATAGALTDRLKNAGDQVDAQLHRTDNVAGMLLNDEQTAQQLRTIINNLKSSSKKLDENMEALQHNFLFRGYFRRKAREEARE